MKTCNVCQIQKAHTDFARKNDECRKCKHGAYNRRKKLATPEWSDTKEIKRMEKARTQYNKDNNLKGGKARTMGHNIPLNGTCPISKRQIVCGLNIPSNLSYEDGNQNYSKRNYITLQELNQAS